MVTGKPRPNIIGAIAVYVFYLATLARTFAFVDDLRLLPWFVAFEIIFLGLLSWMMWRPVRARWARYLLLGTQIAITIVLHFMAPDEDFMNVFFVLVSYQAGMLFEGLEFWMWAAGILIVTCSTLMITLGPLEGLAKSPLNMAGEVAVLAFFLVGRDVQRARQEREVILSRLQEANAALRKHARLVEDVAAANERNRLARELHDSVSQTLFSISLNTRSAQLLHEKKPSALAGQLKELQELTDHALKQIRGMIAQLRLK